MRMLNPVHPEDFIRTESSRLASGSANGAKLRGGISEARKAARHTVVGSVATGNATRPRP
jgi:hypothetical protein